MATKGNRWATHLVVIALVVVSAAGYSELRAGSSLIETAATGGEARPQLGSEVGPGATGPAESPPFSDPTESPRLEHEPQREPVEGSPDAVRPDLVPAGIDPLTINPGSEGLTETGNTGSAATATNVMRFVYFVEQDRELDPAAVASIEQQAIDLQAFWYEQFGGTFYLANDIVTVIEGDQVASWYDTTPNGEDPRWYRLMNVRAEVRAKLDLEPDDDVRIVGYPTTRIDGRVGANRYADAWMDGDDIACIDSDVATTPYSPDYPANCLSTVAHELGHVYGLGHQGDEDDCMQFGFYLYVNGSGACSFSTENRDLVINDPINAGWLAAEPGDRA
jgi:hypothetical protein